MKTVNTIMSHDTAEKIKSVIDGMIGREIEFVNVNYDPPNSIDDQEKGFVELLPSRTICSISVKVI